jgi:hypothetical protein
MKFTKHIVGEYEDGVQRCLICGFAVIDNRGLMSPAGTPESKGYFPGPVFVSDGNPRISMIAEPDEYQTVNCTP